MGNKFKVIGLITTVFLLFTFLFNFACGNLLLQAIPERIIGVLEIKDAKLIKSLSELDFVSFSPEGVEEESEEAKRKKSLDAMLEGLSSLKNVLFWAEVEDDYSYSWLEINYK